MLNIPSKVWPGITTSALNIHHRYIPDLCLIDVKILGLDCFKGLLYVIGEIE